MDPKINHISGVLLAGGKSRRMGQDKRNLKLSGISLFNQTLQILESVFSEIIIVVAEISSIVEKIPHPVVKDLIPGKGSVGGLYTGLFHSSKPQAFVAACDMPFLNPKVIEEICHSSGSSDVTMVKLSNGLQPMHGVYSKKCLPFFHDLITSGQLRIQDLIQNDGLKIKILEQGAVENIDPDCKSFFNINTPGDFEIASGLIQS